VLRIRSNRWSASGEVVEELDGLLGTDDRLEQELRALDDVPRDPFA
jgi:hypothetical protein